MKRKEKRQRIARLRKEQKDRRVIHMVIVKKNNILIWGYKDVVVIAAVVSAMLIATLTAAAFTVSPHRVELSLAAGGESVGSFTLSNPTDKSVKIKVTVEDWSIPQEGREVAKGEHDSLSWLVPIWAKGVWLAGI